MFDKCDMFWVGGASANVLVATILHKTFNADNFYQALDWVYKS